MEKKQRTGRRFFSYLREKRDKSHIVGAFAQKGPESDFKRVPCLGNTVKREGKTVGREIFEWV
jgi:hypothetical protein